MEDNNKDLLEEQKIKETLPEIGQSSQSPVASQEKTPSTSKEDSRKVFSIRDKAGKNARRKGTRRFGNRQKSPYQEQVVAINRVSKTRKGGRKISFNALVVIGDKKGKVGFALGKALEVPSAIKKAIQQAQKNMITIPLTAQGSIPHEIMGHQGSGKVFLKPAPEGTGIIAGSATRVILELAGVKNIYSKVMGSRTPGIVVKATMSGLQSLMTKEQVAHMRDKDIKEF